MRAVIYDEFGPPDKVLKAGEHAKPTPGPGQALVRMVLSPIHNHDLMTAAGQYGYKPDLPAIGGTEAVGIVEAIGPDVTNLGVGQRVAGGAKETWAQYYLVDAARALPVPDGVDDATACQLVSMPLSAKMILADLGLKSGDWLVQNAGNGAVGKLVAKFGAEQGINVLSLVRRDAAVAEMQALGIDAVVSTETDGWQDRAKAIVGDGKILKAIDSLGGDGPTQLFALMADGSELVNFGAMSGRPLRITPGDLLFRKMTVRGFWAAQPNLSQEVISKLLGELVASAAKGDLKLDIEASYSLEQAGDAARASGEPGRKGKIALKA